MNPCPHLTLDQVSVASFSAEGGYVQMNICPECGTYVDTDSGMPISPRAQALKAS